MDMEHFVHLLIGRDKLCIKSKGYIDTGNTLKDAATGKNVVICPPELAARLLPYSWHYILEEYTQNKKNLLEFDEQHIPLGLRLIPYHTINAENDLMLAFECDFFFMNNRLVQKKPLIGISKKSFNISRERECVLLNRNYRKGVRYDKYSKK
jgi:hypothetical protein